MKRIDGRDWCSACYSSLFSSFIVSPRRATRRKLGVLVIVEP